MAIESLELQIARSKIQQYEHDAEESVVRASRQAQDCMECETFLDVGIAALEWLERAEESINVAEAEGFEIPTGVDEAIAVLHVAWLRPCHFAEKWIAKCQATGYDIRNLAAFRDCCARAQEWLDRDAFYKHSRGAREERFAQEPW
jgi:hypothetical protein